MKNDVSFSLLIIAYQRKANVEEIIKAALSNRVSSIYVSIDCHKTGDFQGKVIHDEIVELIDSYSKTYPGKFFMLKREFNRGCSAAVLSSLDWFFSNEVNGVVLEDDCIPSSAFFDFSVYSFSILETEEEVWLSCGTQFTPESVTKRMPVLCSYPLIWGWASTNSKWSEIRKALKEDLDRPTLRSFRLGIQGLYWISGARRAKEGFVDAWDTPLASAMWQRRKMALLPGANLVSNRGMDDHATHTKNPSPWLNLPIGEFPYPSQSPIFSYEISDWLSKNFYQISYVHPVRNFMRYILDKGKVPPYGSLSKRWDVANTDWAKPLEENRDKFA
jgi:hypothetical protein